MFNQVPFARIEPFLRNQLIIPISTHFSSLHQFAANPFGIGVLMPWADLIWSGTNKRVAIPYPLTRRKVCILHIGAEAAGQWDVTWAKLQLPLAMKDGWVPHIRDVTGGYIRVYIGSIHPQLNKSYTPWISVQSTVCQEHSERQYTVSICILVWNRHFQEWFNWNGSLIWSSGIACCCISTLFWMIPTPVLKL